MKKTLLVFLFVSILACKSDNQDQVTIVEEKPVNEFIVQLNYKSNFDDEFKLSLNNIKVNEFQKKNIQIIETVAKTTNLDKIVANFGENFSRSFTINFGMKKLKEIEIQSIDLTYGTNNLVVSPEELEKYFRFSKYITLDLDTKTLKTQKVDGKHVPLIFLNQTAINILKKGIK